MALRAAKQLYPHLEIHFVAREGFSDAAKRIPWIEKVITLPAEQILAPLLASTAPGLQSEALGDLARWLSPLVGAPWDFIVNWSYSESSSYLTGLLPGRVKLGFTRNATIENTTLAAHDGWSHYVQAVIQGGIQQNIHLTDILTTQLLTALQIHAGEPADAGDAPVTSKSFFHLKMDAASELALGARWRDPTRKWVAFQLGAGREEKTWDPAHWASLARKILKNHPEYGIALLGGDKDIWREEAFLSALGAHGHSVVSLVGKSDFDLWASVISRCQWVFSCDTAAVHLASVLGTRVINLSIGPVRLNETGPYGNGHYVLSAQNECEGCNRAQTVAQKTSKLQVVQTHTCGTLLRPEIVYGTWSHALELATRKAAKSLNAHFERLGIAQESFKEFRGAVIYRSRIRSTTDGGGVVYEPIDEHPMQLGEWTSLVMGHIARAWYCGWVPPVGSELVRTRISPALIQKLRELDQSSQLLAKICDEANRTALLLNRRGARLRSNKVMPVSEREEIRELGNRLQELDSLIDRLGKTHAPLQAFAQMSKVLMHNIKGEQLAELGKESANCYRQLADGVGILRDWLKHTLNLARPVAIATPIALSSGPGALIPAPEPH
jgi:ADP-heptose:LPS heptosyltransferase